MISTLPVNAIAGIEWEPGLPGAWQRANAETVASQGVKVWVKARGRVPRFFAYASQRHPISVLKTEFADDDATVLVGFGPDHTQLDVTSVTLSIGITSRPTFDPAPAGLVCRRPMGRCAGRGFLSRPHPAAARAHHAGTYARLAAEECVLTVPPVQR